MPIFYPTEEEFRCPMKYIDYLFLEKGGSQYGCVKIVPPASFRPPFSFDINSE
jgi:histone demethylase JARID1